MILHSTMIGTNTAAVNIMDCCTIAAMSSSFPKVLERSFSSASPNAHAQWLCDRAVPLLFLDRELLEAIHEMGGIKFFVHCLIP